MESYKKSHFAGDLQSFEQIRKKQLLLPHP